MRLVTSLVMLMMGFSVLPGFAQTSVSGNQNGTWNAAGSPYLVTGDITVQTGRTLTIEPGVEVNFQGFYRLKVEGTLLAEGTAEQGIIFTTDDPATGWHSIRFRNAQGTSRLAYCLIRYGKSYDGDYPDNLGGGVMNYGANLVIDHCRFEDNSSVLHGGGLYVINSGQTTVTSSVFTGNHCYMWGGAVCIANSYVEFTDCDIVDNTADYNGAGFYFDNVFEPWLVGCLIAGNTTSVSSGAGINANMSTPFLTNCTLVGNVLESGYARGPALYLTYSEAILTNCIIHGNQGYGDELHIDTGGSAEGYYCDLPLPDWGFTGDHNITADPLFVDEDAGDWRLAEGSPCIDAGTAYLAVEDYYGTVQVTVDLAEGEYDGSAPDMGCREFSTASPVQMPEAADLVLGAYPNPFNPMTTIEFTVPQDGQVELAVFDLGGRRVRSLLDGTRPAGTHTLVWDGRNDAGRPLPSGTYLVRARAGTGMATGKLLLAK